MRIIAGTSKGRRLVAPKGRALRPTSGRVKESVFDVLGEAVAGTAVLDLFAGTGSLGIEALSRGARNVVFVEKGRQASRLIRENLLRCGGTGASEVLSVGVEQAIRILHRRQALFGLIFMDPPYEQGLVEKTLRALRKHTIYAKGSIVVVEHYHKEPIPDSSEGWTLTRQKRIGDTVVSFLTFRNSTSSI